MVGENTDNRKSIFALSFVIMQAGLGQTMKSEEYVVGGVKLARPFKLRRHGHIGVFQTDLAEASAFYVDQLYQGPLG